MTDAMQFYVTTLIVLFAVDLMACWALNLQFGTTGILNFAFVVFMAVGAYTAALLTLGPSQVSGGFQQYLFGTHVPFPLPFLAGAAAGALASTAVGVVVLRRLRSDYQAIVMLVVSLIATNVATNQVSLVNGASGLALIPKPLESSLQVTSLSYRWIYAGFSLGLCLLVFLIVHRISASPLGRFLRACRENEVVVASTGKNPMRLRMTAMVVGGAIAGLSGAVLAQFLGAWGPTDWLYPTTFLYLTAILIGGPGNNFGVLLGVVLVPTVLPEMTRFLPELSFQGSKEAFHWVLVGVLMLAFLWIRPQGLLPERVRRPPKSGDD